MKKYEGVFILVPTIEEETKNSIVDRIKGIIEGNGTIEKIDEWGNRKLAYEIKKFTEGYYVVMNFTADSEVINEIDRISKITDQIIRHMVIKIEE